MKLEVWNLWIHKSQSSRSWSCPWETGLSQGRLGLTCQDSASDRFRDPLKVPPRQSSPPWTESPRSFCREVPGKCSKNSSNMGFLWVSVFLFFSGQVMTSPLNFMELPMNDLATLLTQKLTGPAWLDRGQGTQNGHDCFFRRRTMAVVVICFWVKMLKDAKKHQKTLKHLWNFEETYLGHSSWQLVSEVRVTKLPVVLPCVHLRAEENHNNSQQFSTWQHARRK